MTVRADAAGGYTGKRPRLLLYVVGVLAALALFRLLAINSHNRWAAAASLPELQAAVQRDPGDDAARFALVGRLVDGERLADAVSHLQRLIARNPRSALYTYSLARAYDGLGRPTLALAEYRKTTVLDPKNARAHVGIGAIYAAAGLLTDALPEFDRAYAIDPAVPMDNKNWIRCLENSGRLDEAWNRAMVAMQHDPADESQFVIITDIGLKAHRPDLEELLRWRIGLIRVYPAAVVRGMLIRTLLARSHSPATIKEVESIAAGAFRPGGNWTEFCWAYGDALIVEGKYERARRLAKRGLSWISTDQGCLDTLARADDLSGHSAEAAECRRKLHALRHESPAVLSLQKAVAAAPRDPALHLKLAAAFAAAGGPGQAAEECQRALELHPGDAAAQGLLDTYRSQAIQLLARKSQAPANLALSQ